jgi:hypothetical protein
VKKRELKMKKESEWHKSVPWEITLSPTGGEGLRVRGIILRNDFFPSSGTKGELA